MTDKLWAVLPVELQWEIWTWLPPQETFRQMEVCRAWHENCSDDRFWQAVHMRHDLFSIHCPVHMPAINLAPPSSIKINLRHFGGPKTVVEMSWKRYLRSQILDAIKEPGDTPEQKIFW